MHHLRNEEAAPHAHLAKGVWSGADVWKNTENVKVSDIGIRIKHKSVSINADVESIIRLATTQNFVPVVDDEGIFIGIIKRSDIINYCYNAIKKEKKFL